MNDLAERLHNLSPAKRQLLFKKLLAEGWTLANIPISPSQQEGPFPLSFAQQRLLVLDQLIANKATYNIPLVARLDGKLDVEVLQTAVNTLFTRHDSLRTTFLATDDGQLLQQISVEAHLPITHVDFSHAQGNQESEVQKWIEAEAERPFSLTDDTLIRIFLLRLAEQQHALVIVMHHIIGDGWSINILIRELAALYHTIRAGQPNPLPTLPIQYPDFAIWQREWLQGEILQQQINYWQQHLNGAPATLDLPTDFPRPAEQSYRGALYRHDLPAGLSQHIIKFSQQENATPFMTLLAVYQLLLARYAGQNDIVVGSPIANRNRSETENLIGLFMNMLVLRTRIEPTTSFHDLLDQVRQNALNGYAHQDIPFEKLVDALKVPRDISHSPIFQVAFILQNTPRSEIELGEVTLRVLPAAATTAKYDLTLTVLETSAGYRLLWEYCTDLFSEETAAQMAAHFVHLLENALTNPHLPVSKLPLLLQAEAQMILRDWNDTAVSHPPHTLTQRFTQQAQQTPDALAVTAVNGQAVYGQLTYAQLDAQSSQLAAHLRQYNLPPESLIGLALPRQTEMLVAILGILKAGAAYLPIDPAYPAKRIQYMLDHAQAPLLITTNKLADDLPPHSAQVLCIDTDWPQIAASTPTAQDDSQLDHLAYVIYTSGSTGTPKGVQITQRNLVNFLSSMQHTPGISAEDTLLAVTTLSFDIAGLELYLPLLNGAHLLLADQATTKDAAALINLLTNEPVTLMQATPATWQMLLTAGWQGKDGLTILSGGEALPAALARKLLGCGTAVFNMYGPTETTIWSTCLHVTQAECQTEGNIAIGTPIVNTDVYILDDSLQPVPVGVTGSLYIGGDGVARGYLHQPDLTAERFPVHPFKPNERIYFTGDLARYRRDGRIEFLGRSDHQVKVRGFRIELGEIENCLQQHPAIAQAVVHPQGEQLVAYLISSDADQPDVTALRTHIQESLPAYMIPHRFLFLDTFPLTPNGKVDRRALPQPDGTVTGAAQKEYTAPRNPVEEKLAAIWQNLLKVDQVGVHDNFFALGGDSILAIRFIAQAKNVGITFRANQLFANQTIAELAALADPQRAHPVTAVQTHLLTHPIEPIVLQLQTRTPLDQTCLREAILQIAQLPNLKVAFTQNTDGRWQQQSATVPPAGVVETIPLTHLTEKAAQATAIQEAFQTLKQQIGQQKPPYIAAATLQLPEQEMLLLAVSPLVVDRAGLPHLVQMLSDTYQHGQLPDWPQTSWQDWQSATQQQPNTTYWQEMETQIVPLPVEPPMPTAQAAKPVFKQRLAPSYTAELQQVQDSYNMSLQEVVLTAVAQTLTRWQKSEHLWLLTAQYHRGAAVNGLNTRITIGQLQTNVPLHVQQPSTANPDQWLQQTKTAVRQLPTITHNQITNLWPVQPQISFVWQTAIPPTEPFVPLSLAAPHAMTTPLVIVAGQIGNQLHLEWSCDPSRLRHSTILALSKQWQQHLDQLIAHTKQVQTRQLAPADFPEAQLNQAQLNQFLSKLKERTKER